MKAEPGAEIRKVSKREWYDGMKDDIDPAKHAGEGWFATDEYARPADLGNAHVRAEVGRESDYYPTRREGDAVYPKRRK